MNRGTRTLIVIAVAVVVATLATMAVYRAVQQIPERVVERPGVPVVVAARALPVGTMLAASDVRVAVWPQSSPVSGAFASVEAVLERGLIAEMVENEPVTPAKLAPVEAGAGLPPVIPPGMRAIAMQTNEVIGVGGFVTPGNRVDVVVTVSRRDIDMSRIVVSNVKVLASGTRGDQQRLLSGESVPSVVTLLVTPTEAERIALATVQGRLHLTLRNPLDGETTQTPGVRISALLGEPEPPPAPPRPVRPQPRVVAVAPPPPPPEPKLYTVETIRAAKRTEEVVK
ncbi:MAG: Flp pilus assembly protein CpaB [Vicinamibacterales bacterium]